MCRRVPRSCLAGCVSDWTPFKHSWAARRTLAEGDLMPPLARGRWEWSFGPRDCLRTSLARPLWPRVSQETSSVPPVTEKEHGRALCSQTGCSHLHGRVLTDLSSKGATCASLVRYDAHVCRKPDTSFTQTHKCSQPVTQHSALNTSTCGLCHQMAQSKTPGTTHPQNTCHTHRACSVAQGACFGQLWC